MLATSHAALAAGTFTSSDPQLNAIWSASVQTAQDMLAPGPLSTDWIGRDCTIDLPVVLLDGVVRDRCPYVGDEAVIDRTLDASTPHWDVQRSTLAWFASHQRADGAIPSSPLLDGSLVLFDYNAFWLQTLHDYVLYSGDVAFARDVWPNVARLIDVYYVSHLGADGLLVNDLGPRDYAYIHRRGAVVAYYNAQAVYAIRQTAQLATWVADAASASAWNARAETIAAPFSAAFWDEAPGAFSDTTDDRGTHPQDGNAFRSPVRDRDARPVVVGTRLPVRAHETRLRQHDRGSQRVGRAGVGDAFRRARLPVHVVLRGERTLGAGR